MENRYGFGKTVPTPFDAPVARVAEAPPQERAGEPGDKGRAMVQRVMAAG